MIETSAAYHYPARSAEEGIQPHPSEDSPRPQPSLSNSSAHAAVMMRMLAAVPLMYAEMQQLLDLASTIFRRYL